jgi:hypothetical protein
MREITSGPLSVSYDRFRPSSELIQKEDYKRFIVSVINTAITYEEKRDGGLNGGHWRVRGLGCRESDWSSVCWFYNSASLRLHIRETTDKQDGREPPIDPGECEDGVKNAADVYGPKAPSEDGPPALSGRERGIPIWTIGELTEIMAAPTKYMIQMMKSKTPSAA